MRISPSATTPDEAVVAFRIERAKRPAVLPTIAHVWLHRSPISDDGHLRDDAFIVHPIHNS